MRGLLNDAKLGEGEEDEQLSLATMALRFFLVLLGQGL